MRRKFRKALLSSALLVSLAGASLRAGDDQAPASGFTDGQLAYVRGWIQERAPGCPPAVADTVAAQFLDDLRTNHPASFEQVSTDAFPSDQFESVLLRDIAGHLPAASWESLKEQLALRRVQDLVVANGSKASDTPGIFARLRGSDIFFERLVDGKIEDDDLLFIIKKGQPETERAHASEAAQPKVLTADDIVAAFAEHNQDGGSLPKLRAYVIEGDIESPEGGKRHMLLFKLRPDFVRVVVQKQGLTQSIVAGHAGEYWRQTQGSSPLQLGAAATESMRGASEFLDPLFAEEGYTFTRLPDGSAATGPYYRVGIKRPNGSGYIARIDPVTYHQIGREEDDGVVSVNSDFRKVAGIFVAFSQESTSPKGVKTVFRISRFTPNPGLTQILFQPPPAGDQGYFTVEHMLASAAATQAPSAQ